MGTEALSCRRRCGWGYYAALKAAGVDVGDAVMRWGRRVRPMFSFRDPDGNILRIVETPAQ